MAPSSDLPTRLTNVWYGSVWLLMLAAVIYGLTRGHSLTSLTVVASLATFVVFSILVVRIRTRLFACLTVTTLVVPLYLFETYLTVEADLERSRQSRVAHFTKLRAQGIAAYPAVFPSGLLDLWQTTGRKSPSPIMIGGREFLPLAGIPNALTSYCPAPDDSWVTYRSDAFGFRNPAGTEVTAHPKFALLGDSFVQGYCVADEFTYAAQISVLGPTASYGMNGNSVLMELATYREYVKALRPDHIIWFFFEGNDLSDYLAERSWPLLRAYLDPAHVQDLKRLNGSISAALKQFIDQHLTSEVIATVIREPDRQRRASSTEHRLPHEVLSFLLLRRTRAVLRHSLEPKTFTLPVLTATEWREITNIWREVVETQRQQGGQITFVYIPAHWRFLIKDPSAFQALERKVATLWSGLGADYVTLTGSLEAHGNPLAYYNGIHFTAHGYRLTADVIVNHLRHSARE